MDNEYWNLVSIDKEDDESLTLSFYCGSKMMVLTFPKEKIERILKIYATKTG